MNKDRNIAFVDGQNLHLGTIQNEWRVDHRRFRIYLRDKYDVAEAYYVLGYVTEEQQELYNNLQKAGFIVIFKEHSRHLKGEKKGNVDADIVFEVMKTLIDRTDTDRILLVSGDGDYKKLVDYLIRKQRFLKILFPNRKYASSLYKQLGSQHFDYLESPDIRVKIAYAPLKKGTP